MSLEKYKTLFISIEIARLDETAVSVVINPLAELFDVELASFFDSHRIQFVVRSKRKKFKLWFCNQNHHQPTANQCDALLQE